MSATPGDRLDSGSWFDLTPRDARSVLDLAMGPGDRPIDLVVERLIADDAESWLASVRENPGLRDSEVPFESLLRGDPPVSLDALTSLKNWCKERAARARDNQQRADATLLYFLSLAAALDQHARLISGQRIEDVVASLRELAPILPGAEREMVERAIGAAGVR